MNNNKLPIIKYFKKNYLLLLSTVVALCLFLSPSLTSLLIVIVIFVAVLITTLLGWINVPIVSNRYIRLANVMIAIFIAFMGLHTFKITWTSSSKISALANMLHLSSSTMLLIGGIICCILGFYSMYTLSCWVVTWINQFFKGKLPEQRKSEMIANLKRNWFFPISALAFFCLSATLTLGYFIGVLIAFVASLLIASQISSMIAYVKQNYIWIRIISILTTLGICWGGHDSFCADWNVYSGAQTLEAMLPIPICSLSVLGAIVSIFFIYFNVVIFWKEITRIFSGNKLFTGMNVAEWIVYAMLIIGSFIFVIIIFTQTEAFYGTEHSFDIIYTSDSPSLVKGNVYLALTHAENDLRQPLFAVFAAPFIGMPYLLGKLLGLSASFQAMLINMVQVIMLFTANFMLTKIMKLNPLKRICFMILTSCTYTHLLFTLMMEQYIIAYFWLIFCMFLISEKKQPDRIVLWGAGGTLLTSMVLLPFLSEKNPIRDFKEWFTDMVNYGLEFITIMLIFCRFDVFFNFTARVSFLNNFTGQNITVMEKVRQYTAFIINCFFAPDAGANTTAVDHISWQMNPVTSINFIGVVIFLLVMVSAIINREKENSLIAIGWIVFSVVMFVGLGWGTKENGLILYSLYFGWAFVVLLYQLVEKIENKLNIKFLIPVFCIGSSIAMIVVNVPAILKMVNFAITFFPV